MAALLNALIPITVLVALFAVPIGIVSATILILARMDRRKNRRSPLTDKLLHQAGAQARQRVEIINGSLIEKLSQVALIGPTVAMAILLSRVEWRELRFDAGEWLVAVSVALAIVWLTWRIVRLARERRKWLDGMRAEIAAAQQFDRLQAEGYLVLHDIPAEKSNIDHVVIGPTMVFAVETKSRRKSGKGKASATVTYDGKALKFPGWIETKPLEQARAQARWLSRYLHGETGDTTPVTPVVCLPGWFVPPSAEGDRAEVRVINPKLTRVFKDACGKSLLDTARRNRIVYALHKRYPESSD